ncbi:bifunctional ADP-dependent NAD(P)H-hydrate dehydratase/NAD(P)H-hydrate epimerase [Kushneria phosphatilytica]|uniref:Bifunctional NAD(P)H-hydrate repair enzyme n=1 Tax=Kushneria phosphatilytica TaxID=657387 RepID=A0A1S1NUC7_9GAMM|nr:bifunctional ADP-dependent NAD(P)H-hydrate dehydratase/NAD(P)H-hydrate epimerase [Kushneria phosphatilytica]OHV09969.1 bifunctional ADP-dependent (S)-NAD(P)H-hydrate dehydratase/NAD(P)H-hydrate epimerase [Kushneria phosphatilytica]QEL11649.1 bifunctional ADP-dependent NAD(P)H-hydrate dehydratase/NAD(P)H-hydrate epimerase [Kushneria phosphatilytica]
MINDEALALYSREQAGALDRTLIDAGTPGFELMSQAGEAAWASLQRHWPHCQRLSVLCGAGNNAGDGYVVAALAAQSGWQVEIVALKEPQTLSGEAAEAVAMAQQAGVAITPWQAEWTPRGEVLVDALLGTGLTGEVRAPYDAAIRAINQSALPVLAIDLPSGLDADTGAVLGCAVRASRTVTFIGRKFGLYTGQAPDYTGSIDYAPLSLTRLRRSNVEHVGWLMDEALPSRTLPQRQPTTHKGQCGHLLVVGGREGFGGSAIMATETAARLGAGLVSLATSAVHIPPALTRCPEMMVKPVRNGLDLKELLEAASGVLIGPGLGQQAWGEGLMQAVLNTDRPCVVDADGLNLLASRESGAWRDNWILTPHPGEAARLLDCSTGEVQQDRRAAARALQDRYGGVIVLKGAGTLVVGGQSGDECLLSPFGNPGMASGGMGDVLGGMIASLLVQGLPPLQAAATGVAVHGMAADRAAASGGERGLLATDLACFARQLVNP